MHTMHKVINRGVILLLLCAAAFSVSAAYEWENVGPGDRIGGRMISAGYLRGKVVLLDRRDYGDPSNKAAIQQLQTLWATYKSKPFILLGSHHGKSDKTKVEALLKKLGVTYPVYTDAWLKKLDPTEHEIEVIQAMREDENPSLCVIDSTGQRKLFTGRDTRAAQGVVGSAIMGASTPMAAKQYNFLLDYETKMLPGRAYLRLKEYRARFPKDARKYDAVWSEMSEKAEIKKLAKLVELARLVKDRDLASTQSQRITPEVLQNAIEKYSSLKQSEDPNIAQEAKNALADLKFCEAALGK